MKRLKTWVAAVLFAAALFGPGCNDSNSGRGSETHWLAACESDATCSGGTQCVCGTCTLPCAAQSDCSPLGATAVCARADATIQACQGFASPAASLCLMACTTLSDCFGGSSCVSGACVPNPRRAGDAGGGNSTGGAGGRVETGGASGSGAIGQGGGNGSGGNASDSGPNVDASDTGAPHDSGAGGNASEGGARGSDAAALDATSPDCAARVLYDPRNCGRCGHDCEGGNCVSGTCTPTIVALGTAAQQIVADENYIYWVDNAAVRRVSAAGGPALASVTTLADNLNWAQTLAVNGTSVFFTSFADALNVGTVPIGGGGPATGIVTGVSQQTQGIALDSSGVYWGNSTQGTISRVPFGGGTIVPIASGAGHPTRLAVDSGNVYWIDQSGRQVMKAPANGGTPESIASGQGNPTGISAVGGHVYWTLEGGTVMGMRADGSGSEVIANGVATYDVAADPSGLYWVDAGPDYATGLVLTRALGGGPVTVLASSQTAPLQIATNSRAIFWWNQKAGAIMKIAKP